MKTITLRFNYEFSRVYKRGKFASGRILTVHVFKRSPNLKHNMTRIPADLVRVGFTSSKHRKGAVARNRAKRLLREAYRPLSTRIMPGNDVIFLMRVTEPMPSFKDVSAEMERLLLRLKILSSEATE